MGANTGALLLFMVAIATALTGLHVISTMQGREDAYHEGWNDCEEIHKKFGMTEDDEVVLKHLKSAFKAYITAEGYKRRGDVKKLSKTENFEDFRQLVWSICVRREGN